MVTHLEITYNSEFWVVLFKGDIPHMKSDAAPADCSQVGLIYCQLDEIRNIDLRGVFTPSIIKENTIPTTTRTVSHRVSALCHIGVPKSVYVRESSLRSQDLRSST